MLGIEVQIPAAATAPSTPAYAVLPPGAKRGVVVIHEILGRQPEIDAVCERFGDHGYAVAQPDLFARGWLPLCVAATMRAVQSGRGIAVDQVFAARDWLAKTAKLPSEKIGVIGFCMGGGLAFAVGRGFAVVSGNYGFAPPEEVLAGSAPVIACFGKKDPTFAKQADVIDERLTRLGIRHEVHRFDAGHAFITDGKHPIAAFFSQPLLRVGYVREASEEAWRRILAFFDAELAPADGLR